MCFSHNFAFQFNFSYLVFLQECLTQADYYYLNARPQGICSKKLEQSEGEVPPKQGPAPGAGSSHSGRLGCLWMLLHLLQLTGSQVGSNCELFYSTRAVGEECAVYNSVKSASGRGCSIFAIEIAITDYLILQTCLLLSCCQC